MPVAHIIVPWSETPMVDTRPSVFGLVDGGRTGVLFLADASGKRMGFNFPVVHGDPPPVKDERHRARVGWGFKLLGETVYTILPSLTVGAVPSGEEFHAFVTVVEAPKTMPAGLVPSRLIVPG